MCGAEGNRPRGEKARGATVQGAIIQGTIYEGGNWPGWELTRGELPTGVIDLGGNCPGGELARGELVGGNCPGGIVRGGTNLEPSVTHGTSFYPCSKVIYFDSKMTMILRFLEEGVGLHLGGLNLSLTYTDMVYLLPHSCLLSASGVHSL